MNADPVRQLTDYLVRCQTLGIDHLDVAATIQWTLDNDALTTPKALHFAEQLRSRIHHHQKAAQP